MVAPPECCPRAWELIFILTLARTVFLVEPLEEENLLDTEELLTRYPGLTSGSADPCADRDPAAPYPVRSTVNDSIRLFYLPPTKRIDLVQLRLSTNRHAGYRRARSYTGHSHTVPTTPDHRMV